MNINQIVENQRERLGALRRELHQFPELSFKEFATSKRVADELTSLGYEVQTAVGQTGVVGLISGNVEGPVILLRFDMDGLPIQEENTHAFISSNPGVMHACGHDGHMAIGLVIAHLLAEHIEEWPATFKLVFQPAEEIGGGAKGMITGRVLENPKPDYALATHVWVEAPVGWFGITPGPMMAASATFKITILGKGGHGGRPQSTIDPIIAAGQIISAVQSIVSRNLDPNRSAVVSITQVHGGSAYNIIPNEVMLGGTIRVFDEATFEMVSKRLRQISTSIAVGLGCVAETEVWMDTPAVVNDPKVTALAQKAVKNLLPECQVATEYRTMMAEDMAEFLSRVPGAMILTGAGKVGDGSDFPHHHPKFDLDEEALVLATKLILGTCQEIIGQAFSKGDAA